MFPSAVLLLSLVPIILAETTPDPERYYGEIVTHCLSLFVCNRTNPVCGFNGTHCWHADSNCERAKFNCLQLFKKDFDKVDLRNCKDLTVGGIEPCCPLKTCPNKIEGICGQAVHKTVPKCKWFRNRCELENANCAVEETYTEESRDLCDFKFDGVERICTKAVTTTIGKVSD